MILSRPDHRHCGILGELNLSDSWNLGLTSGTPTKVLFEFYAETSICTSGTYFY